MLTVYPFFFIGRLLTLAGLVLMGLGFLILRGKRKPTNQQFSNYKEDED
jgi:hypothetical protein